jgi:pimeloyl-ACP methyl ester carboxylesterase
MLNVLRVGKLRFQNFALETECGIQAIVTLPDPDGWRAPPPGGKRCHLLVPHVAAYDDLLLPKVKRLLKGRECTFAVDVRGVGQSTPLMGESTSLLDIFSADYLHSCYAQMMGEPLLGRRVHDVLSTLDWLESLGYEDVHLVGRGLGALLALLAATLDDRPTKVTLLHALASWHDLTQTPIYSWPAPSILPGALATFDLDDCCRALKGRVKVIEPWDASMKPRKVR